MAHLLSSLFFMSLIYLCINATSVLPSNTTYSPTFKCGSVDHQTREPGLSIPYGNRTLYLSIHMNGDKLSFIKEVGEISEFDGKFVVNITIITEAAADQVSATKAELKLKLPSSSSCALCRSCENSGGTCTTYPNNNFACRCHGKLYPDNCHH